MTGWDVSRHPEWDMMYAAGLTVREIADLCKRNVATIHRHLQVREKYSPGFREIHDRALIARGPDRTSTIWRKRRDEVLAFQAVHARAPRSDRGEYELQLFRWISAQRRAYEMGKLSAPKIILLDDVSEWNINHYQRQLDERWLSKLTDLSNFFAEARALPRYRSYTTERERQLGVWLHNQHQKRSKKKLVKWREDALEAAIPDWRSKR